MKKFDYVKEGNNLKNHTCILFIDKIKKSLNLDSLNHVIDNIISESDKKQYTLENEIDLYNFYKDNILENNLILNKTETSKYFNISVSSIRRLNNKLKDKNLLINEGKNLYLRLKEE